MNLYVIGPVTGKENENREEFERAKRELKIKGYVVSTPFEVVCAMTDTGRVGPDCEGNWDACMYASCKHIVDGRWIYQNGFAIAMLDGWEQSRGARIEHDLACALGIECRPWMEWL